MIQIRPFLNTDPPHLAELWRAHVPQRMFMQPMSTSLLEQHVLSKPYFDRMGLLVACEQLGSQRPRIIGFVHASFLSAPDGSGLDRARGLVNMLMVANHPNRAEIAGQLISAAERYLLAAGAQTVAAGVQRALVPFYLGLYGGARVPGIADCDVETLRWFHAAGYVDDATTDVLHRRLTGFRPIVDRVQMQLRRSFNVEAAFDPPAENWWQACTMGWMNVTRFVLQAREGGPPIGSVTMWDMEPLASSWGVHGMGILDVQIRADRHRQGLGVFLLGEAMRQLQGQRVTLVEIQCPRENVACHNLCRKLGFETVESTTCLVRSHA